MVHHIGRVANQGHATSYFEQENDTVVAPDVRLVIQAGDEALECLSCSFDDTYSISAYGDTDIR